MSGHATSARVGYYEFEDRQNWHPFKTVVSLHSHTHHSREVMVSLPEYFARIPFVASCFVRQQRMYGDRTGIRSISPRGGGIHRSAPARSSNRKSIR